MIHRFYLALWVRWVLRVALESIGFGVVLTAGIVMYVYMQKSPQTLSQEIMDAFGVIFGFWFGIVWSATFLLALFRSVKFLFERCYAGYRFVLYDCKLKERIERVGYGDLVRVWRKWFMVLVWISAIVMVFVSIFLRFVFGISEVFAWFDIYTVFVIVSLSGYVSLWLLPLRCKRVKVERC